MNLWTVLTPLIVGGAIVPIQLIVTILLLRSSAGRFVAVAWVAGMTATRLMQGVLFGFVFSAGDGTGTSDDSPGPIVSSVLLVLAIVFYVTAARQLAGGEADPDAPPPRWMTMIESASPAKAFLLGAGMLAIGAKFWVFTLGAISAIGEADLGRPSSVAVFLVFVALTEILHLGVLGVAYLMPDRSGALLDSMGGWLKDNNRKVVIGIGVIFGTWFLLKALAGFGVL